MQTRYQKGKKFIIENGWCENPQVIALLGESENYSKLLYPVESIHTLDIASYKNPNVNFISVREKESCDIVGCGAVMLLDDEKGEIKSVFVKKYARRHGIAWHILRELEDIAGRNGVRLLVLETGVKQQAAITLYENYGFTYRGPFSSYKEDPLSIFMEKKIIDL